MEYMNNSIYDLMQTKFYYESVWLKTEFITTFGGSPHANSTESVKEFMGSMEKFMYGLA
jgi:hypothetical protein